MFFQVAVELNRVGCESDKSGVFSLLICFCFLNRSVLGTVSGEREGEREREREVLERARI